MGFIELFQARDRGSSSLWNIACDFYWLDLVAKDLQQVGRGRIFEDCELDWWEEVVGKYDIVEVSPGDFRLQGWKNA